MHLRGEDVIRRTTGCFQGTIKDVPRAMARTAERNRPIVLLLPYITHTLSIRMPMNMRLDEYSRITLVAHTLRASKANLPPNLVTHGRLRTKGVVPTMDRNAVTVLMPHIGRLGV